MVRKGVPYIDGFHLGINEIPAQMGVCSSPAINGGRVYFVSQRFEVVCLDVNGSAGTEAGERRVMWVFDMQEKVGTFPCDAANGSPIIDGDLLYVPTSNGIDLNSVSEPQKEKDRKFPAPDVPNVIVPNKRTGQLVATDDTRIRDASLCCLYCRSAQEPTDTSTFLTAYEQRLPHMHSPEANRLFDQPANQECYSG